MPRNMTLPDKTTSPFSYHHRPRGRKQIEDLRSRIQALERPTWKREDDLFSLGIPEIDRLLPSGGFLPAALYEIFSDRPTDGGAATGFCIALMASFLGSRRDRILWCANDSATDTGELYPFGLVQQGLDVSLLTVVKTTRDSDVLWAMEEGLRSTAFTVVLGEVKKISMTSSRRLQLATEENGVLTILLRPSMETSGLSAAIQRWRIKAAPSHPKGFANSLNEPGAACWNTKLFRSRGGTPGTWLMEWCDETSCLSLATSVCNRPDQPHNTRLTR